MLPKIDKGHLLFFLSSSIEIENFAKMFSCSLKLQILTLFLNQLSQLFYLRFRDGSVWTVGLTVEIKLRFNSGVMWTGPK